MIIDVGAADHWVTPLISLLFAIVGTVIWYLKPGRIFGAKWPSQEAPPVVKTEESV
jgi:hypothetical protein